MKKRPMIMLRLREPDYENEAGLTRFFKVMRSNGKAVDSVALFAGNVHNYLPYRGLEPKLPALGRALENIRSTLKVATGINPQSILGHREEAADYFPLKDMPPMVGHNGIVARNIPCPSSSEYLADVRNSHRAMAELKPEFIWIEDDFRLTNHAPIVIGCFCERCVRDFGAIAGRRWRRKELVERLTEESPEGAALRRDWLAWHNRVLGDIVKSVEQAVHAVDPSIVLGMMISGGITPDYPAYLATLRKETGLALIRPGGGFYTDDMPFAMVEKVVEYSRQLALIRPTPRDPILAEVENFPCNSPMKSRSAFASEITLSIAAGCDGATLNIAGSIPEFFNECAPFLKETERNRPFWSALVEAVKGLPVAGAWHGRYSSMASLSGHLRGKGVPELPGSPVNLMNAGLPLTGDATASSFSLLTRTVIDGMSAGELKELLARSAMLDATAVRYIEAKGLSKWIGVHAADDHLSYAVEQYLDSELNTPFAGRYRDSRVECLRIPTTVLEPLSPKARPLCEVKTDYRDGKSLGFSVVAFENAAGARMVSYGYDPWQYVLTEARINHIHNLAQWLSDGTLPFLVKSPARVCPFVRCGKTGRMVVALVNAGLDTVEKVSFFTPRTFASLERLDMKGAWQRVRCSRDPSTRTVTVRTSLAPWNVLILKLV